MEAQHCSPAASIRATAVMPCLAALQICERVDTIHVQELSDYGSHDDVSWATPYGFGKSAGAPANSRAGRADPLLGWDGEDALRRFSTLSWRDSRSSASGGHARDI